MRKSKLSIMMITILVIINICNNCFAKYSYEYIENAVELNIDRTAPNVRVEYSTLLYTNEDVEVKIIADEEIKEIDGWKLLDDRKSMIKNYSENTSETIFIEDLNGNGVDVNIEVNNIDKNSPQIEILDITNSNKGYESYANREKEINFKIHIKDENSIITSNANFNILLDDKEANCEKNIKLVIDSEKEKTYEVNLKNILDNGNLKLYIPKESFIDVAENATTEKLIELGIEIDNIAPNVLSTSEKQDDGKVNVNIKSNEIIKNINGWSMNEDLMGGYKKFISDIKYQRTIEDRAGNSTLVDINVENSDFLGLEYMAHISETGWVKAQNGIVGIQEKGNIFKIESLAFKTSNKVNDDFFNVSGYAYTHWQEGSFAESQYTKQIFNYGWNPMNGYKNRKESELVEINNEKYIQIGGEGVNGRLRTDINGNLPISIEESRQYKYGISGIKFKISDNNENSIIYQIYNNDIGWSKIFCNGEIAQISEEKVIEAMKIIVVPTSELNFVK